MIMTSVSGHLLGLDFIGSYRNWQACSPMALFDAPVTKYCPQDYQQIKVFFCIIYLFISVFLGVITIQNECFKYHVFLHDECVTVVGKISL